jgi:hypothetical protein
MNIDSERGVGTLGVDFSEEFIYQYEYDEDHYGEISLYQQKKWVVLYGRKDGEEICVRWAEK